MPMFDPHTAALVPAVAAGGALVGLDRTAVGQFMISQPVVVGPVTGWFLGDPVAGLIIGAVLELIWLLDLPVGTFVPADTTVVTVSATAIAVLGSHEKASLDLIGFVILLTTGMVPIAVIADTFIRKQNSRLVDAAISSLDPERISRAHLSGVIVFFLKSLTLNILFIPAGLVGVALFQEATGQIHRAMVLFVKSLPLLGAALVLGKLSMSMLDRSLLAGFAAAGILTLLLPAHPLVIITLVVAAGFLWFFVVESRL